MFHRVHRVEVWKEEIRPLLLLRNDPMITIENTPMFRLIQLYELEINLNKVMNISSFRKQVRRQYLEHLIKLMIPLLNPEVIIDIHHHHWVKLIMPLCLQLLPMRKLLLPRELHPPVEMLIPQILLNLHHHLRQMD